MGQFFTNKFTGENNWLNPALLSPDTATTLIDPDIVDGKLAAARQPYRMAAKDPMELGHFGNPHRSVVSWYDRHYWSINDATAAPYYGGDQEGLGVPFPESHPSPILSTPSSGEGLTGTLKYCWTYVNANGWESAPCPEDGDLWVEITASKQEISIKAPSSFPPGIKYIKVYRTVDKGADFYNVGSIETPGGVFVDNVQDFDLIVMEPASSFNNYPPKDGGKYLCESGGVFFLAIRDRVYYSVQGNPHAWPTLNFIGIDDRITGIVPEFQGVLVFTAGNAFRIIGAESRELVTKTLIPGNQGCIDYKSISHLSNVPVWLSNDGLCLWDGDTVSLVSQRVFHFERVIIFCSVATNDAYYLFTNSGGIVFDRRLGDVFYRLSVTCDYAWYDVEYDRMFMWHSSVSSKGTVDLFGAGDPGIFRYVSPYIGGNEVSPHKYGEILLNCSETATVLAFLDGRRILSVSSRPGRVRIKLPYSTVGERLQIEVRSRGKLSELGVSYGG